MKIDDPIAAATPLAATALPARHSVRAATGVAGWTSLGYIWEGVGTLAWGAVNARRKR